MMGLMAARAALAALIIASLQMGVASAAAITGHRGRASVRLPSHRSRILASAPAQPLWAGTLLISIVGSGELALRVSFEEEPGYEPPQGAIRVDECPAVIPGGRARWILSEDPDDRRDGFWIWGLLKEPAYPFILFELDLNVECKLPDGQKLGAGTYYFRGDHSADKEKGSTLARGQVMRKLPISVALPGSEATYMEASGVGSYVARVASASDVDERTVAETSSADASGAGQE